MEKRSIEELIETAREAGLLGLDFLAKFDVAEIAREYNGIGPEWAGEKLRDAVTERCSLFEPAALIHDLRNAVSDGSEIKFHFANSEFYLNCRKLADRAYPWWSWRRYRARLVASTFCDFVEGPGGWKAWQDAHEKRLVQGAGCKVQSAKLTHQAPSTTHQAQPISRQGLRPSNPRDERC